ncbi:MAG: hypothetical protein J0I65_18610 [Variovorax sp.]|nr:hypothetical protein [Variovorax sp.]
MRPPGEVRQALLDAALALTTRERSPTLMELACKSQVGFLAARRTVDNMRRAGALVIVRTRAVDYRPRPVAEYSPPDLVQALGIERQDVRKQMRATWATPIV